MVYCYSCSLPYGSCSFANEKGGNMFRKNSVAFLVALCFTLAGCAQASSLGAQNPPVAQKTQAQVTQPSTIIVGHMWLGVEQHVCPEAGQCTPVTNLQPTAYYFRPDNTMSSSDSDTSYAYKFHGSIIEWTVTQDGKTTHYAGAIKDLKERSYTLYAQEEGRYTLTKFVRVD